MQRVSGNSLCRGKQRSAPLTRLRLKGGAVQMIRLYRTGILHVTPFHPQQHDAISFFNDNGITFTNNPLNCHLFVTGHSLPPKWKSLSRKTQLLLRYQFRRRILIWSNEPYNTIVKPTFKWSAIQPAAHIMNLYTNDVYLTNFTFFFGR